MSWTGSGRKTAVLCTAVVLLGTLALPAQAAPLTSGILAACAAPPLQAAGRVPASPEIPSPEEIAAAKSSESATAAEVTRIDGLLADASAGQEASLAASLQANNAYGEALVELSTGVTPRRWRPPGLPPPGRNRPRPASRSASSPAICTATAG